MLRVGSNKLAVVGINSSAQMMMPKVIGSTAGSSRMWFATNHSNIVDASHEKELKKGLTTSGEPAKKPAKDKSVADKFKETMQDTKEKHNDTLKQTAAKLNKSEERTVNREQSRLDTNMTTPQTGLGGSKSNATWSPNMSGSSSSSSSTSNDAWSSHSSSTSRSNNPPDSSNSEQNKGQYNPMAQASSSRDKSSSSSSSSPNSSTPAGAHNSSYSGAYNSSSSMPSSTGVNKSQDKKATGPSSDSTTANQNKNLDRPVTSKFDAQKGPALDKQTKYLVDKQSPDFDDKSSSNTYDNNSNATSFNSKAKTPYSESKVNDTFNASTLDSRGGSSSSSSPTALEEKQGKGFTHSSSPTFKSSNESTNNNTSFDKSYNDSQSSKHTGSHYGNNNPQDSSFNKQTSSSTFQKSGNIYGDSSSNLGSSGKKGGSAPSSSMRGTAETGVSDPGVKKGSFVDNLGTNNNFNDDPAVSIDEVKNKLQDAKNNIPGADMLNSVKETVKKATWTISEAVLPDGVPRAIHDTMHSAKVMTKEVLTGEKDKEKPDESKSEVRTKEGTLYPNNNQATRRGN